jgi:2-polyprenyl-3-methyl-5-hydroxy-6-metoxy-1,4-benzoquinol methylase
MMTTPTIAERLEAPQEIRRGERFGFGKNWQRFLSVVNEQHISAAEGSLRKMLRVETLAGRRFLDIGSGSGLFSLAAVRLGASVHSFDYDPQSVACAHELKHRYAPDAVAWTIEQGSVLDRDFIASLGEYDVVYSWGVLHHTGAMWLALEHAAIPVAPGGKLFVAIYNDQGRQSKRWRVIKKTYCSSTAGKMLVCSVAIPWIVTHRLVNDLLKLHNPLAHYRDYKKRRGMSAAHDWFDWLGGYPFEVARPEEIFQFYHEKGFTLLNLTTKGALAGCNELVFVRRAQ